MSTSQLDQFSGRRLANLGMVLLDKLDVKESRGELLCVIGEVQCMVEPLLAANEMHVVGEAASTHVGDVHL